MLDVAPATPPAPDARPGRGRARLPYLPGLDGLRALAVVSVLLYHAQVGGFRGGFLGVEVFFVISGYLITLLLLGEWGNEGRLDLSHFWLRRARRLLPALFLVLAAVTIVAVVFLPDEVASLRGDVASAFAYVTNWSFIFAGKSYFESIGRPSMVQHLWSLAVEEQFYLVWPLLFIAGMKVLGRRWFPWLVALAAVGSTALMWSMYQPGADPSRVYYGTDTRAAALLIGCALAFMWAPWRLHKEVGRGVPVALDVVGVVALAVLGWMLYDTNEFATSLYHAGFAKLSLVTALVIAVVVHPAARVGRVLGMRPLRWIGLRSYGLYLWHWPVFVLTRPGQDLALDGWQLLTLRLAITVLLAELSYRLVEVPIRTGALGRLWEQARKGSEPERRRVRVAALGAFMAPLVVVTMLAVVVMRAQQPPTPSYLTMADGTTTDGFDPSMPMEVVVPTSESTTTTTLPPTTTVVPDATVPVPTAPTTTVPPGPVTTKMVVGLGDSVMLGAAPNLVALGPGVGVDAVVGRQVSEGIADLNYRKNVGQLGDIVVIHLGNNGSFTDEQFDQLMEPLAGVSKVIFVNCKVPRPWEEAVNTTISNGVTRYPNAMLIDWYTISQSQPGVFWDDGMHLRPAGAALYAQAVASML